MDEKMKILDFMDFRWFYGWTGRSKRGMNMGIAPVWNHIWTFHEVGVLGLYNVGLGFMCLERFLAAVLGILYIAFFLDGNMDIILYGKVWKTTSKDNVNTGWTRVKTTISIATLVKCLGISRYWWSSRPWENTSVEFARFFDTDQRILNMCMLCMLSKHRTICNGFHGFRGGFWSFWSRIPAVSWWPAEVSCWWWLEFAIGTPASFGWLDFRETCGSDDRSMPCRCVSENGLCTGIPIKYQKWTFWWGKMMINHDYNEIWVALWHTSNSDRSPKKQF